jgi:hypothetical protein
MKPFFVSFVVTLASAVLTPSLAAASIDWASVGNTGNPADTTGYGSVAYEYKISRYETTIAQDTDFLNAVAATDTYGLYNAGMPVYAKDETPDSVTVVAKPQYTKSITKGAGGEAFIKANVDFTTGEAKDLEAMEHIFTLPSPCLKSCR